MGLISLGKMIETLGKERGVDKNVVVKALEQAFLVTVRKKYGIQGEYETKYNEVDDDIEIFQYKNVVENGSVRDKTLEIELESAKGMDENVEVGDQLGLKIENPIFTRVDVQTAKQIIFQKVRDAEREILFAEYKHKEGQLVTGIARRYEKGNIIVDLGKADAILNRREIIPSENFKTGDRIQAYLSEVVMTNRGPEIRLSRTSPMFLVKLFELEVPEIQDGTIEVKSAAREPGQRAKIAVLSIDKDIDPIGACVGMKGSRVQNIINELQGEKIDVIRWSDDLENFIRSALSPAVIGNVMVNMQTHSIDTVVEDDQLSLAIGRRGQNVRLAAMLSGFRVNIISKTKLQEKINKAVENLLQGSLVSDPKAQILVQRGIMCLEDLMNMNPADLMPILDITEDQAGELIAKIKEFASSTEGIKLRPEESEDFVSASAVPAYKGMIEEEKKEQTKGTDKFSETERRLREELAAFKLR